MSNNFEIYMCPACGRTIRHELPSTFVPNVTCWCSPACAHIMIRIYPDSYIKIESNNDERSNTMLKGFNDTEEFEKFCKEENKNYCPMVNNPLKGLDQVEMCHWCRISFLRGCNKVENYIKDRLK